MFLFRMLLLLSCLLVLIVDRLRMLLLTVAIASFLARTRWCWMMLCGRVVAVRQKGLVVGVC